MLAYLKCEMVKRRITNRKIAEVIGVCENTARKKISGQTKFQVPEAIKLRDTLFPDMSIEALFAVDNDPRPPSA